MSELPKAFRIQDLQFDISVLRDIAAMTEEQFPVFQGAAIQEHRAACRP